MDSRVSPRVLGAVLVMLVTPMFFSTNLVFGRHVTGDISPFLLAFIRWASVALILSPFMLRDRAAVSAILSDGKARLLVLGTLGMWMCGGIVYLALKGTTATNGTLIYTTSPVMILGLEAAINGRRLSVREIIGSIVAFAGVAVIVLRGDWNALVSLELSAADLAFVGAALAWAFYSLIYRDASRDYGISNMGLFALVAAAGAIVMAPFAAIEVASGEPLPQTADAWRSIAGIIVFASLLAFSGFQYGVRVLGPAIAGIFMYALPAYGVTLAVIFLGEEFHDYHTYGIAMVMGGIVLATLPVERLRRGRSPEPAE